MKRKLFSLAMVVCLVLTLIPAAAFAAGTIAKIGDVEYSTLQAAINAAQDGDTIVLCKDTDENIKVENKSIIINLNNCVPNGSVDTNMVFMFVAGKIKIDYAAFGKESIENAVKKANDENGENAATVTVVSTSEDTVLELPVGTNVTTTLAGLNTVCSTIESSDKAVCVFSKEKIEETAKQLAEENPDEDIKVTVISATENTDLTLPEGIKVEVKEPVFGSTSSSPSVKVNGTTVNAGEPPYIVPAPAVEKPVSSGSGIKVTYNGGNSFSTSKSAVPTSVEIDGVEVPFTGNGKNFTVGCIDPSAKWVTVRWNSTSVTVNFKPDASVVCAVVAIPKTGDMPVWAAVAAFFGF